MRYATASSISAELRLELNGRCAQVIAAHLTEEGLHASVRTIQRTLEQFGLLRKYGKWKKLHQSGLRPKADFPGDLVEIDTIHISTNLKRRLYIYTVIDVKTRYAFAHAAARLSASNTVTVVDRAKQYLPFEINCMQSDHGPEFGQFFTDKLGVRHRHSRVRKPNDNAHIERFNHHSRRVTAKPSQRCYTNQPSTTEISSVLQHQTKTPGLRITHSSRGGY